MSGFFGTRTGRRAAGIAALAVVAAVAYGLHVRHDMTDFGVCFQAGGRFLDGETLYRASDGHLQFKYAPLASLFFALLAALPVEIAKAVWYILTIGLLVLVFKMTVKVLPPGRRSAAFAAGWGALIALKFIGREVELGQVNVLILALLVFAVGALSRGRAAAAGALATASMMFKPYAAVFWPYFLLKRKILALAASGIALAAGFSLPAVRYGWKGNLELHREWIESLSRSTPELLSVGDNASLYAFVAKITGSASDAAAILFAAGVASAAATILMIIRSGDRRGIPRPEVLESAFLMVLIPMVSPLGWIYNYLYAIPAIVILLTVFDRMGPAWKIALAAAFLSVGVSLREIMGAEAFRFYNDYALVVPAFIVILAALASARHRGLA